jgi:ABC-type uncharacterized transport system permease subunit
MEPEIPFALNCEKYNFFLAIHLFLINPILLLRVIRFQFTAELSKFKNIQYQLKPYILNSFNFLGTKILHLSVIMGS